jgi:hypothetical protein
MIESVSNLINKFNSAVYKQYLGFFSSASSELEFDKAGKLIITDQQVQHTITRPVYRRVSAQIAENSRKISELYNIYAVTKEKRICSEIQKLSDLNFTLHRYKELVNSSSLLEDRGTHKLLAELNDMKNRKLQIKELVALLQTEMDLKKELQNKTTVIDFYIETLPEITSKEITPKKKPGKRQEKIKEKIVDQLLKSFPLNKFKFQTIDDCNSKSKSNPYYISKEDLVATIQNDNDLKRIFPKSYKKLKKEELCAILFQPPNK